MVSMVVDAQRIDKPGEPYEVFCVIEYRSDYCECTFRVEKYSNWPLRNPDGQRLTIHDESEAINYMTKRGWCYVEFLGRNSDGWKRFLFKKTVRTDEEALDLLYYPKKK